MKITKQESPPEDLLYFDDEVNLTPIQVEDVVEYLTLLLLVPIIGTIRLPTIELRNYMNLEKSLIGMVP